MSNTCNRDFKGVWIPQEIWLCKDLTAIDKVLLTEIYSLDNEQHCTAGNDYLAEFCGVSEATITRSIKKLINLGYIERISFDGRHRVLKMINQNRQIDEQTNQNDDSPSAKCKAINIYNNISNNTHNNNISNSKELEECEQDEYASHMYSKEDLKNEFLGSAKKSSKSKTTTAKGKSLYSKCVAEIDLFTQNLKLRTLLVQYLAMRLEIKDKPMYFNQWKGLLNKLYSVIEQNPSMNYEDVVQQSIEKGYASFYPVNTYSSSRRNNTFSEGDGLSCEQSTDTEEDRINNLGKKGRRTSF